MSRRGKTGLLVGVDEVDRRIGLGVDTVAGKCHLPRSSSSNIVSR